MFEFNETQRMIEDMFRQYMTKELEPLIDDIEDGKIPVFDPLRKMMDTLGLKAQIESMDLTKPLAGGVIKEKKTPDPNNPMEGMDVVAGNILVKEMSRVSPGIAMTFGVSTGLAGGTILGKGTLEQKQAYGLPLMKLDKIGAWCLTEPGAGSDALGSMRTSAVEDSDSFVLNGSKTFITNGPVADIFVVYARLKSGQSDGSGIQNFIVLRNDPGFSVGSPFQKMGMKASPTSEIFFEDCRIPRARLIGGVELKKERGHVKEGLATERSGVPAMTLGLIERCVEISVQYAREREQFGRPLIDFQLIQNRLARMYIAMENVRNIFFRNMHQTIYGGLNRLDVCASKLYCSEMATWVANESVAILGGYGYMREYIVERLLRDARLLEIGAGTAEMQILTMGQELAASWKP